MAAMRFYRRGITSLVLISIVLFCCAFPAGARETLNKPSGTQFALVIGNGAYESDPLPNPANDASDIAAALQKTGFLVTFGKNLDIRGMRLLVQQFIDKLPKGATVFFFYSGHGVQHNGQNYLIPIGAISALKSPSDLDREGFVMSDLLEDFNRAGASVTVVFLDACRDSPFTTMPEIKSGLARNVPKANAAPSQPANGAAKAGPQGVLVSYSTAPNAVAQDGTGRNSPYTKYLKTEITKPNVSLEQVLKTTRSAVTKETGGAQTPWYESSISGDVFPAGQNRISIEELIGAFLPEKSDSGLTWMAWGPEDLSSVDWKSNGVEDSTKEFKINDFWHGVRRRRGDVVITIDGQPTHYVVTRKDRTPVPWHITMLGANSGVQAVEISNDIISHEFSGLSKEKFLHEDIRSRNDTDGIRIYDVNLPNKEVAFLEESFSCGSAGCNFNYVLFVNPTDKAHEGCH